MSGTTDIDHSAEALAMLDMAKDPNDPRAPYKDRDMLIEAAKVHAMLALADATRNRS